MTTSIVSHTVTVHHDPSLRPRTIARALDEAGYELDSTTLEMDSEESLRPGSLSQDRGLQPHNNSSIFGRWLRRESPLDEETKRKRHEAHCELCRAKYAKDDAPTPSSHDSVNPEYLGPVVDGTSSPPERVWRATLSITGMSCSSCVGKIAQALEEQSWIISVNVVLMTNSAYVDFRGARNSAEQLLSTIDDLGYEASLEEVTEVTAEPKSTSSDEPESWNASYSIEGMTCSACVRAIQEAVQDLRGVQSVDVSLINHSANVVFDGRVQPEEISTIIEDIGYGATLNEVLPVATDSVPADGRRSVSIKVAGMYCEHCPQKIIESLKGLNGNIEIEKSPTLSSPIATISYVPQAPDFTIRTILKAIAAADPQITPSVYRPPSLEERAKEMHARVQRRIFLRVLLSVLVAIPTFVIGIVYMALLPENDSNRQYLMEPLRGVSRAEWALFILATPVYFFAADVFHRRTMKELYTLWKPGSSVPILRRLYRFGSMDMLISLGTTIAYFSSVAELAVAGASPRSMKSSRTKSYFDSVVFLTMFLLIGRLIEAYSKSKAGDAVSTLQRLRPREALLEASLSGEKADVRVEPIDADMVDLGDIVRVVHGASPPWDGVVVSGNASFDESSLTGESKPVRKDAGDLIYTGTINKGGPVSIKITRISGDSMLDQIIKVVREGQAKRAPIERVADVLTSYFVPVITLIAIATWLIWLGLGVSGRLPRSYLDIHAGGWPVWSLQFAIAVFIIACPCGIGLAAPTALFVGGGLAAKHGILVKGGGEAFQEASKLDIVVFDKTGTLTQGGDPKVTDHQLLLPEDSVSDRQQLLSALKHLEEHSSHPIGRAIVEFCRSSSDVGMQNQDVEEVPGKGMQGSFHAGDLSQSVDILVGNEALMADHSIALDAAISATLDLWKGQAKSVVIAARRDSSISEKSNWELVAIFGISDALRPESRSVVESLKRRGVDVWMLSGDNTKTACAVGDMVGIAEDHIIAGVLPQQKAEKIQYLQRSQLTKRSSSRLGFGKAQSKRRAIVAMVGDGVNDSPALTVADVGIAVGSGSDVAISSADFILVNHDMTTLLTLVNLSRVVFRRVKFNFAWALVYNLVALPIAAGVLYPVKSNGTHIRLDPVWASLAMALSSVSVICSSLVMRTRLPVVGFRAAVAGRSASDDSRP